MIHATVNSVRGLERAAIEISPIALVAGGNGAGKSSLCQAIGAALCLERVPVARPDGRPAFPLKDLPLLLHHGAKSASVTMAHAGGKVDINWKGGEVEIVTDGGAPPRASKVAAGRMDPLALPQAEFSTWLQEVVPALPTREDLEAELSRGAGREMTDAVWRTVESQGWDGAHEQYKKEGARAKGAFEEATGEKRYGLQKAEGWRPSGWNHEGETRVTAGSRLERARKDLESILKRQGADEAEVSRWRRQAEGEAVDLAKLMEAVTQARAALSEATLKRANLAPVPADPGYLPPPIPCPKCGAGLQVKAITDPHQPGAVFTILPAEQRGEALPAAVVKARGKAIAAADGEVAGAKGRLDRAEQSLADGQNAVGRVEAAREALNNLPRATVNREQVEEARERLQTAEAIARMVEQVSRSETLHRQITGLLEVVRALAPEGLRATALGRALGRLNAEMEVLCKSAGWETVVIGAELSVRHGIMPVALLSASEVFRVRVVLQVAAALCEGSDLVVIDGADILDRPGKGGLLRLLRQAIHGNPSLHALVAMTMPDPGTVPDLAKNGHGQTYWMAGGRANPLPVNRGAAGE